MAFGSDRLVVIEARRFGEDGPDTAAIIDVSTRTPRVESRIDLAGGSVLRRRATVVGSMLYVAGRDPLLQILDLDSRRLISSLEAPEGGTSGGLGITVSDGLAFLSGWQIQVADVSALENPRWIGELTAPNDVHYVERRGDTLFIGTGGYLGKIPLDCR